MLVSRQWQDVPGAAGVRVYPLLSAAGITTSNTLVIVGGDAVFVIDPGGTAEQAGELEALLADCAGARPVTVLLTHAHIDHFVALDAIDRPVTLIAHRAAAEPLRTGNMVWTQAQLVGRGFRPRTVDVRLFDDSGLPPAPPLPTGPGESWARHVLPCGGHALEIMPAPGHSPCGLVFRLGHLLAVGDLPFAANPGLVGIAGWDQAGLIASASQLKRLLAADPALICLPGHGTQAASAGVFARQLQGVLAEARRFGQVAVMDSTRLSELHQYAAELLEETCRLCTLLAVRLDLVSFHLDALEAHDQAGRVQEAVNTLAVDKALEDIADGYRDFYAGRQIEMQVLMRAAARLQRVAALIGKGRDQPGVSVRLAGRVERLLARFAGAVVGLSGQDGWETFDAGALVLEVVGQFRDDAHDPDEALLAASEDETAFAAALASRMAARPPMNDLDITCTAVARLLPAEGDRQLLADALTTVIELLGSVSADRRLRVEARTEGGSVTITVEGEGCDAAQAIGARTADLWRRLLAWQQATLRSDGAAMVIGLAAGR